MWCDGVGWGGWCRTACHVMSLTYTIDPPTSNRIESNRIESNSPCTLCYHSNAALERYVALRPSNIVVACLPLESLASYCRLYYVCMYAFFFGPSVRPSVHKQYFAPTNPQVTLSRSRRQAGWMFVSSSVDPYLSLFSCFIRWSICFSFSFLFIF
jgi:hypothetical protein